MMTYSKYSDFTRRSISPVTQITYAQLRHSPGDEADDVAELRWFAPEDLPLLVAVGASFSTDAARLVEGGMTYGVLSMDSFAFGLPNAAATSLDHAIQEPAA